jgi:hypothetical protein
MYVKSVILAALMASARAEMLRCGNPLATPEQMAIDRALVEEEDALLASGSLHSDSTTDVDVYFHIVASGPSPGEGYVPVGHY